MNLQRKLIASVIIGVIGVALLLAVQAASPDGNLYLEAEEYVAEEFIEQAEDASNGSFVAFQDPEISAELGDILAITFDDSSLFDYGEVTGSFIGGLSPFGDFGVSAEEEMSIVDDEEQGRVMEIRYEPQSNGSKRVQSKWKLDQAHQEVFLSYKLKFMPGWEYGKGGKLPGLAGGTGPTGGNPDPDGMSARLMWRGPRSTQDEQVVIYLYWLNQTGTFGQDFASGHYIEPGVWATITQRVNVGTPGNSNGSMQLWIDGVEYINEVDMNFQNLDANWGIDQLMFSTFYGGSDESWAPSTTTYARFDDFLVSTNRQGVE